jgi:hypothetical protein
MREHMNLRSVPNSFHLNSTDVMEVSQMIMGLES